MDHPTPPFDMPARDPEPYDAATASPLTWLGRRGGLWPRAVGGYFFEAGCPRCGCADCEPDALGWLTCEVAELDAVCGEGDQ